MTNGQKLPRILIIEGVVAIVIGVAMIMMLGFTLVSRNADLAYIKKAVMDAGVQREQIENNMISLMKRYEKLEFDIRQLKEKIK